MVVIQGFLVSVFLQGPTDYLLYLPFRIDLLESKSALSLFDIMSRRLYSES